MFTDSQNSVFLKETLAGHLAHAHEASRAVINQPRPLVREPRPSLWESQKIMVKVFEIVLDPPASPSGYLSGSKLSGKAVVEAGEPKSY